MKNIKFPITQIDVTGFKSIHDTQSIELMPLTLLAGTNSSGKSSMMQPLLLLKQTLEATFDPGALLIDGPNVKFTSTSQMFSRLPNGKHVKTFSIRISRSESSVVTSFTSQASGKLEVQESAMVVADRKIILHPRMSESEITEQYKGFITSISDDRVQNSHWSVRTDRGFLQIVEKRELEDTYYEIPTLLTPRFDVEESIQRLIHLPGLRGNPTRAYQVAATGRLFPGTFEKYTASLIAQWYSDKDNRKLKQLSSNLNRLGLAQNVSAKAINDTQIELQVGRTMKQDEQPEDMVNIADAGFGVSQVLPILVALIAAVPGQIVYIEQPEIHLHPRAQSIMAEILADAANRGVIVVAETHSDLLLLGVQTLVAQGKLSPDKVILHWFQRDEDGSTKIDTATLDESGSFGDWPEDFGQVALDAESRYLDAAEAVQQKGK